MDNQPITTKQEPQPKKLQKVVHFYREIQLGPDATIVPYQSLHTTTSKKSKKSKKKFEEFSYYRFPQDKSKIMKVLFKDEDNYMINSYYPFTDPTDDMQKTSELFAKNLLKVVKTETAYIGHFDDQIVVKKMSEVNLGQDGNQFDTIGDNFETIKIDNKQRFQQFLRILKSHPRAMEISIRVIIDESIPAQPKIIDYEFFKRQAQLKASNQKFIKGQ